jgi:hypothetical protein
MPEWHAVRSRPGAEGRAQIGIEASGMVVFMPVEPIRKNHRGDHGVIEASAAKLKLGRFRTSLATHAPSASKHK